jgi:uncharacterized protein
MKKGYEARRVNRRGVFSRGIRQSNRSKAKHQRRHMNKNNRKDVLAQLLADRHVRDMENYMQHGNVSTYEHCKNVTRLSCRVDRKLRLHSDRETLLMGAMLHDFYLYDWHDGGDAHHLHGFTHAREARRNARRYFGTDAAVNHVIASHMWPLNLTKIPATREAWVVCLADKVVALNETLFKR